MNERSISTSTSLIMRAKNGQAEAWQKLTALYGPMIFAWCRNYQLSSHDSSDILQEVLTAVSQNLEQFQLDHPDKSFRGWLWTITRNKINELYRKQNRSATGKARGGSTAQHFFAELPERPPEESVLSNPGQKAINFTLNSALKKVRKEFEKKTWMAFWRTVVDGQPTAEVAEELKISQNAVRKYKSRVFRRLREELGDIPGSENL